MGVNGVVTETESISADQVIKLKEAFNGSAMTHD
jgi:hypothetical protein